MKSLVFGYFDLNFGDDWLINRFCNKFHKDDVVLMVSDDNLFSPYRTDSRFTMAKSMGKFKAVLSCDELNIVGGSMFQRSAGWLPHFLKLLIVLISYKIMGRSNFVYGCNLKNEGGILFGLIMRIIFSTISKFYVRDFESKITLVDYYGVANHKIEVGLDLAAGEMSGYAKNNNSCSISIINNSNLNKNEYFLWLEGKINNLKARGVDNFTLFSFDSGHESDLVMINLFINFYKERNQTQNIDFDIYQYTGSIESLINEWAISSYAICSRFHSYILASNLGQNINVLAYSQKTIEYIKTHRQWDMEYVDVI
ncbi:polysaccharide pyruvyl transferase family protein [Aeromonas dhakensis]|uniref:polysaccharide pyruvyl transferase family protein n=1 Tax=Aeromonas dhakensis TaxID=196024 RepID=UPI003464B5D0